MLLCRQAQVDDGQHHENEGLQRDDQHVEHGPAEVQGQLPVTNQRDQYEDQFARKQVAEQPQAQDQENISDEDLDW